MKKFFVTAALVFSGGIFNIASAQEVAPPGAGDRDLNDKNIKTRSVEMERIKRDAKKPDNTSATTPPAEDQLAAKYGEIKTDYEQIQLLQDAVIKAYQSGAAVDYGQISKSAAEINKSARRLNANLFPAPAVADNNAAAKKVDEAGVKKEETPANETKKPKSVRDLIVELDNAVGIFATSPMFQNLRTVDAAVSEKAQTDLEKIIETSALLDAEARKMIAGK